MLDQSQNKMIDGTETKNKDVAANVTIKAVSASVNEYHFPGSPDFLPMSVRATTIEDATEIWELRRQPVTTESENTPEPKAEAKPVVKEPKETKAETK
jgi:hypothetical protein